MSSTELIELGVAIIVVLGLIWLMRRAAERSRQQAGSARERLGVEAEVKPVRQRRKPRPELEDGDKTWSRIRKTSKEILAVDAKPLELAKKPFVLLVLGVNGVGKTTTIGKLAKQWTQEGNKVLLAAGDTFRAAATEQLEEW